MTWCSLYPLPAGKAGISAQFMTQIEFGRKAAFRKKLADDAAIGGFDVEL